LIANHINPNARHASAAQVSGDIRLVHGRAEFALTTIEASSVASLVADNPSR
jgi:hypothetical protein